jgi:putative hydrolase of the HAD superfamily
MFIFFDLDGTLVDVSTAEAIGVRYLYETRAFGDVVSEREFSDAWVTLRRIYYDGYHQSGWLDFDAQREARITTLFRRFGVGLESSALATYAEYHQVFERNLRLFPDVVPALQSLAGIGVLGVITNGDPQYQYDKLARTGIANLFEHFFAAGAGHDAKPSRSMFLAALSTVGCEASDFYYIGDSWDNDIVPCLELGITPFLIQRPVARSSGPDAVVLTGLGQLRQHLG